MDELYTSLSGNAPPVVMFTIDRSDQRLITAVLDRYELRSVSCASLDELFEHLERRCGSLVVAEEALVGGASARLSRVLNEQPTWSELPVIVLRHEDGQVDSAMQSLLRCGGVRWLFRPFSMQALAGMITTSVEARLRQEQVDQLLQKQTELNAELRDRGDQLRELAVELVEAEDRERKRIAELLHDDLQQLLVGASLRLEAAVNQIDGRSGLTASLDHVRRLIGDAQRRCRALSHDLFPSALREADLPALLCRLAQQTASDSGLLVKLDCEEQLGDASPTIMRFVYRSVREMLLNVVKHARTDTVWIAARRVDDQLQLSIKDRGVGFRVEQIGSGSAEAGIGLLTIRERAQSLGGDLTIESAAEVGSCFRIRVPIK